MPLENALGALRDLTDMETRRLNAMLDADRLERERAAMAEADRLYGANGLGAPMWPGEFGAAAVSDYADDQFSIPGPY
tara:strand:- start:23388 stop:23621 length:234 start_codon:yes stop_codon:yes gene_type:complete